MLSLLLHVYKIYCLPDEKVRRTLYYGERRQQKTWIRQQELLWHDSLETKSEKKQSFTVKCIKIQ